jgi:hypothetical protein
MNHFTILRPIDLDVVQTIETITFSSASPIAPLLPLDQFDPVPFSFDRPDGTSSDDFPSPDGCFDIFKDQLDSVPWLDDDSAEIADPHRAALVTTELLCQWRWFFIRQLQPVGRNST